MHSAPPSLATAALAAIPEALRPSFEATRIGSYAALGHRDTAAGRNTRANDLHNAELALQRAGFPAWHDGGATVYLLGERKG